MNDDEITEVTLVVEYTVYRGTGPNLIERAIGAHMENNIHGYR